jgi:threonine synthase
MSATKFIYRCNDCGREYSSESTVYLCPACNADNNVGSPQKGVLKTIFDYKKISAALPGFNDLKKRGFIDLLPIETLKSFPPLRIGNTPLYQITEFNGNALSFRLFLKDDSQNPTWSFKDRASALVSAYARDHNLKTIIAASTGNAGSSLAGICASQRQKAVIIVPEAASLAKLTQIVMYGARLVPVKGTYDEAFDLSVKATEAFGWYNRNTAFNPLTIEGKKTVAFELYEQLAYRVPDRIFVPAGDGVILSGVYKGFEELLMLNITDRMPVIVAVQSEKSDNLVRNINSDEFSIVPSSTIADSISVDIPKNFYMTQRYIKEYKGETLTVSDEEILRASRMLSSDTGLFAEPAAAAAYAGFLSWFNRRLLPPGSDNVVMLTGSGLKDLRSVSGQIKMPGSIYPSIDNLQRLVL